MTFSPGESPWSVARRLRAEHFDTALVLPNSPRSALEVWLARIPQRVGYARPWCSWLLTQALVPRPGKVRMPRRSVSEVKRLVRLPGAAPSPAAARPQDRAAHQIHDYLHLAAALGANPAPLPPRLEITAAEIREAESAASLPPAATGTRSCLASIPALSTAPPNDGPRRTLPPSRGRSSRRVGNCAWLAFGGPGDWQVCSEIARLAGGGVLNLAGKTSLRQLMALLKLCRVVLTNDTGPMHVAAALGTPVVVPFGSTSPELTGPGLPGDPRHQLLTSAAPCAPCFRRACPIDFRCMTGIRPERVTEAVLQAIKAAEDSRTPKR